MPFVNENNINFSDFSLIENLSEIDILINLQNRFNEKKIYTKIDKILLILNSYEKNFSIEKIENFINLNEENFEPNLFNFVLKIIEKFLINDKNQNILISGESGSGKTETMKNILNCVVYYFLGETKEKREKNYLNFQKRILNEPFEKKLLNFNTILESFGNCKTKMNNNSSRFGKNIKIKINKENKKIIAANIKTFLLEKNRICDLNENETNFHIFYQLLNCGDENILNKLHLTKEINFYEILNKNLIENLNEKDSFNLTMESFRILGFNENEVEFIFKILSAILLLGNIKFINNNNNIEIEPKEIFNNICDLLSIKNEELFKSFTINIKIIAGKEYENKIKEEDSYVFKNIFSKELYNRLFLFLVKKINLILNENNLNFDENFINLFDFPGFECLNSNSLEQLCFNYSDEFFYNFYINDCFEKDFNEMKNEEIKMDFIKYKNNKFILDLIDNIFLNLENCSLQNKNDEFFLENIKKDLNKNKNVILPRIKKDFGIKIKHNFKEIKYDVSNFVLKNKDEIKNSFINVIINSNMESIKKIFFNCFSNEELENKINMCKNQKKNNKFFVGKFKNELNELKNELLLGECNYIFCLNTNEMKKNFYITPNFLFNQIKYLGLYDTILVKKESFEHRISFNNFFEEFKNIFPNIKKSLNPKNEIKYILNSLISEENIEKNFGKNPFLIGITKIFMKKKFKKILNEKKEEKLKEILHSIEIIKLSIKYLTKKNKIKKINNSIINFQKFYEINKFKINKLKKIKKINQIQSLFFSYKSKKNFLNLNKKYENIQNFLRTKIITKKFEQTKKKLFFLSMKLNIYSKEIKIKRIKKINKISKEIIEISINKIINNEFNFLWKKLKPFFNVFLTRKKYFKIYKKGKFEREKFLKFFVFSKFENNLFLNKIQKKKYFTKFIRIFLLTKLSKNYFIKLRENIFIIQNYFIRYLNKKKSLEKINNFYFQKDFQNKNLIDKNILKNIFPSFNNNNNNSLISTKNNKKIIKSSSLKNNKITTKNFFDLLNKTNKKINNNNKIDKNFPENENSKIRLFAKILSIETFFDISEIYDSDWSEEFNKIYKFNMENNTPIQTINLGDFYTILINSKGKIFSFGLNKNLNYNIENNIKNFIINEENNFYINNNNEFFSFCNNENEFLEKPIKKNIENFVSNKKFNLILTKSNEIFCWFNNKNEKIIKNLNLNIKIKEISCGFDFAILLCKNGNVFGMGNNEKNYLGFETEKKFLFFPMINSNIKNEKIIRISCGFKHTFCLCSNNKKLFSFGNNSFFQCGIKNEKIINEINFKEKIIQINCGFKNSVFLSEKREIFYCGFLDEKNFSKEISKFDLIKNKEIDNKKNFIVVRILNSYCKNMNIFYVTLADVRGIYKEINNKVKIDKILDYLIKNWNDKNIIPPFFENIANYFSQMFMKK